MASPFSFIPRKVAKNTKPFATKSTSDAGRHVTTTAAGLRHPKSSPSGNMKGKAREEVDSRTKQLGKVKYTDADYASLICIALSDYALWSDSDLRRKIDLDSQSSEDRGFIPLSYLLRHSRVLRGMHLDDSQTPIVKALREYASDLVEFRLRVSWPSSSAWSGSGNAENQGGYEIRRKARANAEPSSLYSKTEWEGRTLYMENIPVEYRSIPGIIRFTLSLLPANNSTSRHFLTRVQNITLPRHHQDKPGDLPNCKGFALVSFANEDDMEYLLRHWPWDRHDRVRKEDLGESAATSEASKFGFRTVSKVRWSQLKDEYLAYRQRLVDEINASRDAEPAPPPHIPSPITTKRARTNEDRVQAPVPTVAAAEPQSKAAAPVIDYSSPYPFSCLIFAKNVHPETNKTTLRSLFTKALKDTAEKQTGNGLDYIDFSKGMDTCHVRLSSPRHAELLVQFFSRNPSTQSAGLDDAGSPVSSASKAISVELVLGLREQLYWEKVPEKVRRQAVEKAIALQSTDKGIADVSGKDGSGDRGKKKRRKNAGME